MNAGDDLYQRLNVPRAATEADIRAAFRRQSRRLHPDKHLGVTAKAAANDAFSRLKEAYEILEDSKLRKVYDQFGLDAARAAQAPGLELVPFDELAQRFRSEAADGGASGPGASHGMGGTRDAYFTVLNTLEPRIDATGLVVALDDGYDWSRLANGSSGFGFQVPLAALTQVSLSTNATVYASPKNMLSFQYSLMNRPRVAGKINTDGLGESLNFPAAPLPSQRGGLVSAGEFALSLRRIFSPRSFLETAVFFPLDFRDGATFSGKLFRILSERASAALDATFGVRERGLTLALSSSRQLNARTTCNISWATGAMPGASFSLRRDAYNEFLETESSHAKSSSKQNDAGFEFAEGEKDGNSHQQDRSDAGKDDGSPVSAILRVLSPLEKVASPHVWSPVGCRFRVQLGLADASLSVALRRPIGRHAPWFKTCEPTGPGGAHIKIRSQIGLHGWEIEAGGGRRYIAADTFWSTSVAVGTHGVMMRIKIFRSGHRFQLPIILVSTTADPRIATLAAIATSSVMTAVQIFIVKPWRNKIEAAEREEAKRSRAQAMNQAKADAEASRELMHRVVDASRERENAVTQGGLLIVRAIYGLRRVVSTATPDSPSFVGREIEKEVIEVGDCVQALVEDSRVQIISSTKSTLMGFWDPTALGDEDKALRVWYRFRNVPHDCLILDSQPLELPLSTHRVL